MIPPQISYHHKHNDKYMDCCQGKSKYFRFERGYCTCSIVFWILETRWACWGWIRSNDIVIKRVHSACHAKMWQWDSLIYLFFHLDSISCHQIFPEFGFEFGSYLFMDIYKLLNSYILLDKRSERYTYELIW